MGIRISHPQTSGCATIVVPEFRKSNEELNDSDYQDDGEVLMPEKVLQSSWINRKKKRRRNTTQTVEVQTDEVQEDELDWDLTDLQDRETQTLPDNPTPFQLNRTDAMVQTDYRYFPLAASEANVNPAQPEPKKTFRDAESQTERTTASVSTQTEEEFLLPTRAASKPPDQPPSAVPELGELNDSAAIASSAAATNAAITRNVNNIIHITPYNVRESSASSSSKNFSKMDRRSSSMESSAPSVAVSYSPTSLPSLMKQGSFLASSSPSLSVSSDVVTAPLRAPKENAAIAQRPRKDSMALWETLGPFYLNDLLPVVKASQKFYRKKRKMIDVSVQTETKGDEESPEFAARPPPSRKEELLRNFNLAALDNRALAASSEISRSIDQLVGFLCPPSYNDLQKVRVIFRWITKNIRYDWKFVERAQTAEQVLQTRAGVSKDFVALFQALSDRAAVRTRRIQGFARNREFRVGRRFDPSRDVLHFWLVVFIFDTWRFVDPTYGAGYTDAQGRFHAVLQDHFFLPDPDVFIYTHYPYHPEDIGNYYRWQLMDVPISLDLFNSFPMITPHFWKCGLRFRKQRTSPFIFSQHGDLQLASSVYMRYKYSFYPADEAESDVMNRWVFASLKEGGAVVTFSMTPNTTAPLVLRILAQPEDDIETDDTPLGHVVSFLVICTKPRKYFIPYPPHDGVWGANPRLYQCGLDLVSEPGPLLVSWGGRKHLTFEKAFDVLLMFQLCDKDGNNVELKGILKKDESADEIHVTIIPPSVGYYKLLLYGIPRPEVRGRWRLPLLAVYLLESKMLGLPEEEKKRREQKKTEKLRLKVRAR
ncbi:hillarin [Hyalella azteca]|uniref:Hillarin n=1 Tax=Hyalella azteca TaxID=294128 RepID=A0A8B7NSC6_HYAAZ|nr:hillarin [Hyalella azteca]